MILTFKVLLVYLVPFQKLMEILVCFYRKEMNFRMTVFVALLLFDSIFEQKAPIALHCIPLNILGKDGLFLGRSDVVIFLLVLHDVYNIQWNPVSPQSLRSMTYLLQVK